MLEPTDYQGNSKKGKENVKPLPEKKIEKVVTGEIVEKKPGLGSKFKSVFLGADAKSTGKYVILDVILPEFRNLAYRAGSSAWQQFIFGDHGRRGTSSRTDYRGVSSYQTEASRVINTRLSEPRNRGPLPPDQPRGHQAVSREPRDMVLVSKADAERVLETLLEVVDQYGIASAADFLGLIGQPIAHVDHKWGWEYLGNVQIVQVRDGYVIDVPPLKEI